MNRTMIDDLPSADELDRMHMLPPGEHRGDTELNVQKFIRNSHPPNQESGMYSGGHIQPHLESNYSNDDMDRAQMLVRTMLNDPNFRKSLVGEPNCVDFANHVSNCPICSKFYSNDKSVYIVIIAILCIVSLLLLKRVLNV
jgi:hypothetical protein